jgi:DNA-directed RNA polymerase subunit RPC12/RpoP
MKKQINENIKTETNVKFIDEDEVYTKFFRCLNCNGKYIMKLFNYCPHCGLKINKRIGGEK